MKEKETLIDKIGKIINLAGTTVLMNLLFLTPCIPFVITVIVLRSMELLGTTGGIIGLVVSAVPVVFVGPAWCALVSAIRYNIRGDSWFQGFKDGLKKRFFRSLVAWCLLLVAQAYFLIDINHYVVNLFDEAGGLVTAYIAPLVAAGLMYMLVNMLTVSLMMLNVYIPTKISLWIRSGVDMIFKAPLQLFAAAVLFAAPVVLAVLFADIFIMIVLIFLGFYFTLAALIITMVLKETLIDYLVDARAEGTLLSEEGSAAATAEDDEEDEEA